MKKKYRVLRAILLTAIIIGMLFLCGCMSKKAAHINYMDDSDFQYAKGNYVYSTVTFTGSELEKDSIRSVKEIETEALEGDKELGYQGEYSLLTSGGVFTQKIFTGIKLYDYLLELGLSKKTDENIPITVVSADGYSKTLTVGEIKESKYNNYDRKGAATPNEDGVPVLLAFGSDKLPLVGATGGEKIGKKMTAEDGYDKEADNLGGPIRLIIGQTSSNQYNAPDNSKWVNKVIVGEAVDRAKHTAKTELETALNINVYDKDNNNKQLSSNSYTVEDVEKYGEKSKKNICRNYYGGKHFYEGVSLWGFIEKNEELNAGEGKVKFTFSDGTDETVDMEYLRNLSGEADDYTTEKSGKTITGAIPALGYAVDGEPTSGGEVYGLLSAKDGEKKKTTAKVCTNIDIYKGATLSENPSGDTKIKITGKGIKKSKTYSVKELENRPDITKTLKNKYSGVDLYSLLAETGLTVDADGVVLNSSNKKVQLKFSKIKKGDYILATRKGGKPLTGEGSVALQGDAVLADISSMKVTIRAGQWTHAKGGYKQYEATKISINGSAIEQKKTYSLKELEKLEGDYVVKELFASSAGSNGYQGVKLKKLIEDNLKAEIKKPSKVTVVGKDGYEKEISVESIYSGMDSRYQSGEHRDLILAYSIDGLPLVPNNKSEGYQGTNAFGPVRLVMENQVSGWVKNVSKIIVRK